jgi:hypothetical protein
MKRAPTSKNCVPLAAAALLAFVAGNLTPVRADLIQPISQVRTVAGAASADDSTGHVDGADSDAAVDFGLFDSSRSVDADLPDAYGSGGGWQESELGTATLVAEGSAFANGESYAGDGWGSGDGSSIFEVSFQLTAPADATVLGEVVKYDNGRAWIRFTGPDGLIFDVYASGETPFGRSLFLPAGQYTLEIRATGSALGESYYFDYAFASYSATLTVCPAGDLDEDGVVGLADLSVLLAHYGGPGGPYDGDLNRDGSIGLPDLAILLANYGASCSL